MRRQALSLRISCSLLLETGFRGSGALVDVTTHRIVESTKVASVIIVGDFSLLEAWLEGGDAEAYFCSASV